MFHFFEGATADTLWQGIAQAFRAGAFHNGQSSRAGVTSEILHAAMSLANPRQRWVASRRPAINVAFALVEVVWILRGRNDAEFLNYFNKQLVQYAGASVSYHGAYGHRLRRAFGLDQLERAFNVLRSNPESRQVVLQIWDAPNDLPSDIGLASADDVPCNISSLLKVRDGRLEWLQVMRSNDVFRGLPYNLVQFTTLQEVLAGWLGLEVGSYNHVSDSLHIYENCSGYIQDSLPLAVIDNQDDLAVPKEVSDAAFLWLEDLIEQVISPEIKAECLLELIPEPSMPAAFVNIARVICAEGARRRYRRDIANTLMAGCTNPVFVTLFHAWLNRTAVRHPIPC